MAETVSGIQSLNVDEWTHAFEAEGDKFFAKAESEEASDSSSALMEEVSCSGSGCEVIGLLVMPKESSGKVPLVISIGGLDGWKEARISQLEPLLEHGVAIFSLDMPGTGQSGVKFNDVSVPSLLNIIRVVLAREGIDASRVVLYC